MVVVVVVVAVVVVVVCPELAERVLDATGTRRCTGTCPSPASSSPVQEPWRRKALGCKAHEPCAVVDRVAAVQDVPVRMVGHGRQGMSSLLGLGVVVVWVLARVGLVWMVGVWV